MYVRKVTIFYFGFILIIILAASIFQGIMLGTKSYAQPIRLSNSSHSVLQNSTLGSKFVKNSPEFDFRPMPLREVIPNSYIIQLRKVDTANFGDIVKKINTDIKEYEGKVNAVYENFGMLNIVFGNVTNSTKPIPFTGESLLAGLNDTSQVRQLTKLRGNPDIEAIYNDLVLAPQVQVIPNSVNRVDGDLGPALSGNGLGTTEVDIAILDSGVQNNHPDLNVFKCVSFVFVPPFLTGGLPFCNDLDGHGTHVAGIAAALDNNIGVVGIAPGARIWAVKVCEVLEDESGTICPTSFILGGLNFVATNSNEIEVVNLSLGGPGADPPLESAITGLVQNFGVVVVVAAGNESTDAGNTTPARTPAAITVSAMRDNDGKCGGLGPSFKKTFLVPFFTILIRDDSFATFSNFGSIIDMAAPGAAVFSTFKGSGFATMSGTSMASPAVAGAAALFLSLNPTATPADVVNNLKATGTHWPPNLPNYFSGLINIFCDGKGGGYFSPDLDGDNIREPLLYLR